MELIKRLQTYMSYIQKEEAHEKIKKEFDMIHKYIQVKIPRDKSTRLLVETKFEEVSERI